MRKCLFGLLFVLLIVPRALTAQPLTPAQGDFVVKNFRF